jgi:FkbH-like protein
MYQLIWKNRRLWKEHALPGEVGQDVGEREVALSSMLDWEEHCVECSAPACYTSCGLYADRGDGHCRRFSYGLFPNPGFSGLFGYGADVHFKRWGKLEALWPRQPRLHSIAAARWIERCARAYDALLLFGLNLAPKATIWHRRVHLWGLDWRKGALETASDLLGKDAAADAFYLRFFSPALSSFKLQLEFIQDVPVCRRGINVTQGWNEFLLPAGEIKADPAKNQYVRLWVDADREARLIFTWLDFVVFAGEKSVRQVSPAEKVKCVAWDLDNTLWKGVIGDDGKDGVEVVPEAVDLIRRLDERGMLQTIVSKNEHPIAWEKITELGLADFFLYPAINWNPKSVNLRRIAGELNINVNTFALIDDSRFERGEVSAALPQVRVYDPEFLSSLLGGPEFDVSVTVDTRSRRLKYMEDISRKSVFQKWEGCLDDFLRDCSIELNIRSLQHQDQKDRCLELLHRSNQFHLSGKRYTLDEFEALLQDAQYESYVLDVQDRYGDYGIVGFVSVHNASDAVTVTDFVMSCRVARKKIENAFFHWYLNRKATRGKKAHAVMKVTGRNQPLRQVYEELKFEVVTETDSEILMRVDVGKIASAKPPITIKTNE